MQENNYIQKVLAGRVGQYFPALLLVLFVVVEFNSKYVRYLGHETQVQKITKAVVLIFMVFAVFSRFRINWRQLVFFGLLTVAFTIGQLALIPSFTGYNMTTFSRFMFPLVLFLFFTNFKISAKARRLLFLVFEGFLTLNFILILIGLLGNTYVLKTYLGSRFGVNGLLLTSATSTYVYFCALGYFYFVYSWSMFRQRRFWITLLSCLLIGTKSLYLGVVLFGLLLLLECNFKYKKAVLGIGVLVFAFVSFALLYWVPEFVQIREQDGLLSAVLSYRDQLFLEHTWPYIQEQWGVVNYLFGGVADFTMRSQMEFVDLFFFWGTLGGLLYLFVFGRLYFTQTLTRGQLLFFVLLALIVFVAGNFFTYTSIPLYLVLVREAILHHNAE